MTPEMKLRQHYEKPNVKRAREKAEKIRRARKLKWEKAGRFAFEGSSSTASLRLEPNQSALKAERERYREALKRICDEEED